MMWKTGVVSKGRLGAFLSTCIFTFLVAASANAQTNLSTSELSKAVQLLQQSFNCSIPVYHTPGEGNWVGLQHDADSYVGDSQKFKLWIDRHQTIIGGESTTAEHDHIYASGNYADVGDIKLEDGVDHNGKTLKNSVVIMQCHGGKECFKSECTNPSDMDGCGTEGNPNSLTERSTNLSIQTCSASAASDIKFAIELLAKANHQSVPDKNALNAAKDDMAASPIPAKQSSGESFRVPKGVSGGILNMRNGPGTEHQVVVAIPAGANDISVSTCRSSDTGKGKPWCKASWEGHAGWISSCCIVDARTGLPPRREE